MSTIFAAISNNNIDSKLIKNLIEASLSRGKNSSALLTSSNLVDYELVKSNKSINNIIDKLSRNDKIVVGYSGLNASLVSEVAAIEKNGIVIFHDGIVNDISVNLNEFRVTTATNTEYILQKIIEQINKNISLEDASEFILDNLTGTVNCILVLPELGKLVLLSNHGSLYYSDESDLFLVASEERMLADMGFRAQQVKGTIIFDYSDAIPEAIIRTDVLFKNSEVFQLLSNELNVLEYKQHSLKRCTKCVLPETMPFIRFDSEGICNYCHSYIPKNKPKDIKNIFEIIEPYRKKEGYDCIIPFSGGRDSCFTLHVAINELKLKPVTYTYDWGMVTDVGRRNISLMCGKLGVENIVISGDIEKKRRNIAMNFKAWLKNPDLGMLNLLTAGDKHFFRHINKVKKQTDANLNIWGVNPLEVTHFKTGFLGIEPDFEKQRVYASGKLGQLRYHSKRFMHMLKSPGYFNRSLWDTYSGEYYRSFTEKKDYLHTFDYWQWSEKLITEILDDYEWERASDTPTTWRIGDGTAGIFNYINYTLAGFTEHDTFRSNQIREGEITRDEALQLLELENAPCHDNLRWYLASIGFDFVDTIKMINSFKRQNELLY